MGQDISSQTGPRKWETRGPQALRCPLKQGAREEAREEVGQEIQLGGGEAASGATSPSLFLLPQGRARPHHTALGFQRRLEHFRAVLALAFPDVLLS